VWLLVGCGGPASSGPRGIRAPSTGRSVSVLAYNIFLRPHVIGLSDKKKERLPAIISAAANFDLVGFSEAFDDGLRAQIRQALKSSHPYAVEPPVDPAGIREDGGVFFLSRFPLELAKTLVYRAGKGADALSAKGVIYARALIESERVDFLLTHLQSGEEYADVRERQLGELTQFAAKWEEADVPQIVMGDLNVIEAISAEYQMLLRVLGRPIDVFRALNPSSPGFTWDGVNNPLAGNGKLERIDYILCRHCENKDTWLKSSEVEPVPMKVPAGKARFGSDHYAVSAHLEVPF